MYVKTCYNILHDCNIFYHASAIDFNVLFKGKSYVQAYKSFMIFNQKASELGNVKMHQ